MPFDISNKGVISLPKPLGSDAPDTYVFTVMAKDCGGRISEEATTVNIIVDKDCTPGIYEEQLGLHDRYRVDLTVGIDIENQLLRPIVKIMYSPWGEVLNRWLL